MNKYFIKSINNNNIIPKDKWQLYLMERKNIKKNILNTKDELNNLKGKRNKTNNQLNLLQEDEKDRKIVNKIMYFTSLIIAISSFIISKNLLTTTILNIIIFCLLKSTPYFVFGSKEKYKKNIKDLLCTIENYNNQIDEKSKELDKLNILKIQSNKALALKPIQEPTQTYTRVKVKKQKKI